MGFLKKQSIRLMRESWANANELAEEMRAIFNSEEPMEFDGPITINNNNPDQSAITIRNGGNGPTITINNQPDPPIQFPDYPPIDFPPFDGSVTIYGSDGNITTGSSSGNQKPVTPKTTSSGGGGVPGRVLAKTGGRIYNVEIYEKGIDNPFTQIVTARQLRIATGETIPEGTGVIVTTLSYDVGNSTITEYYFNVPTWL